MSPLNKTIACSYCQSCTYFTGLLANLQIDLPFSQYATQDNIHYWILLFLEKDPVMTLLKKHPEFGGIDEKIKTRFWENLASLKKRLEGKVLM